MIEVRGNIWDYYNKGDWIVITTNGTVKTGGACVMGRGVAKEARDKFPKLQYDLGSLIKDFGNEVYRLDEYRVISFPVKYNWWEKADVKLIEESCKQLIIAVGFASGLLHEEVCMVRPGCGNGQLDWKDVKPILEKYLDDRFVIVERFNR